LVETLFCIRKFFAKTVVAKYSGEIIIEESLTREITEDIALMKEERSLIPSCLEIFTHRGIGTQVIK